MPQNDDDNKPSETNPETKPQDDVQSDPNLIIIMQESKDPKNTKGKLTGE